MPPRVQKITSVSVPLVEDIASCWRVIFFCSAAISSRRLDDLGVVAAVACVMAGAATDLHVPVLRFADGGIIRGVGDIHDERDIRLQ